MRLDVIPGDGGLVDSPVTFRVTDTTSTSTALTIQGRDDAGVRWRSECTYPVDAAGTVVIADPDAPWTTMSVDDPSTATLFEACDGSLEFTAIASDGATSATCAVTRVWGHDLVTETVRGPGWELAVYRPSGTTTPLPGVLVFPGTMVGRSVTATTALLASHGHAAAVLYYTQRPGLPDAFVRIATERIADGIAAFTSLPYVDADSVAIHASSVGVQTALATLSTTDTSVRALVLVAPSHVVFQALRTDGPPEKASALMHDGVELPYVPVRSERLLLRLGANLVRRTVTRGRSSIALATLPAYAAGLRDDAAVAAATIPVEEIECPVLTIAGTADQCYPAATMARAIVDRRKQHGARFAADDVLALYPGVGHFIRPPAIPTTATRSAGLIGGGTPGDTARAQRDAWTRTMAFLLTHLS